MNERDKMFQHLVLAGLWVIVRMIYYRDTQTANLWRATVLGFGDIYGVKGEGAAKYRRERTFEILR